MKPAKPAMPASKPAPAATVKAQAQRKAKRMAASAKKPTMVPLYHPGPAIDCQAALDAAVAALCLADPQAIPAMLALAGPPPLRSREPGFEGLVWIIVSQQLSVASANAIFARVRAAFVPLTALALQAAGDDSLRACGLSSPKMRSLRALAQAVAGGALDLDGLAGLPAEAAHAALVTVKGIGPWTADIFLLSCLGHADAWPAGDLALQEAAKLALKLPDRPDTRALDAIGERWRPHRAVAARILWAYYRVAKSGREGMATL